MTHSKKKNTIIAATVGAVIFVSAAIAGIAASNGYLLYKNAVKNLLGTTNYTLEAELGLEFDGEIHSQIYEKYREKADIENGLLHTRSESASGYIHERYYQDGIYINGSRYDSNGNYSDEMHYEVRDLFGNAVPETVFGDFLGTRYRTDESNEKIIKFAEIAADLVVGDLKNNFIYNGSENGIHSYSIELDSFQIPEIISSGFDLIMTTNKENIDVADAKEWAEEGEVFYYLYDNVIIKNVSCDVFVDEDGNISENNLSVTVAGNDWDGKEHTARFFANISCSDIGKTKPDRFDTENTPNTRKESEQYAERIKELERLIESEKTTDEERAQYENELKRKKQDMEQHYKSGTIETAISEKHMKEE